jgi:hypothetical protein
LLNNSEVVRFFARWLTIHKQINFIGVRQPRLSYAYCIYFFMQLARSIDRRARVGQMELYAFIKSIHNFGHAIETVDIEITILIHSEFWAVRAIQRENQVSVTTAIIGRIDVMYFVD